MHNPKLYDYLHFDPAKIMDFKQVIIDKPEVEAVIAGGTAEAAEAMAGAASSPKVFTLPIFWKWMMPV